MRLGARALLTVLGALLSIGIGTRASAQAPATTDIAVDATAPGTALEKVWPFHGYDEVNYTTNPTRWRRRVPSR